MSFVNIKIGVLGILSYIRQIFSAVSEERDDLKKAKEQLQKELTAEKKKVAELKLKLKEEVEEESRRCKTYLENVNQEVLRSV